MMLILFISTCCLISHPHPSPTHPLPPPPPPPNIVAPAMATRWHVPFQGPILLLRHDIVTIILANGSAAFIESCVAIGWNSCDSIRPLCTYLHYTQYSHSPRNPSGTSPTGIVMAPACRRKDNKTLGRSCCMMYYSWQHRTLRYTGWGPSRHLYTHSRQDKPCRQQHLPRSRDQCRRRMLKADGENNKHLVQDRSTMYLQCISTGDTAVL